MKVVLKDGRAKEVNASFALRLIEQGKAVPVKKQAQKKTTAKHEEGRDA